jgi:hypothetical protein
MRNSSWPWMKQIASCLIVLLVTQAANAAEQAGQQGAAAQEAQSAPSNNAQEQSPGVATQDAKKGQNTENAVLTPALPAAVDGQQQGAAAGASNSEPANGQEQSNPAKPVGAAAAPASNGEGVAGSRLTGAVIAPAKQRRVHSVVIRVAIIVGACVAIGTVAALSRSNPSQPR